MQAYNASFARVYNLRWSGFANNAAPSLRAYYESTAVGQGNRSLLDVCCGTGLLALHFLDHGYQVTGLDLSAAMLDYARSNAASYIVTGQARFVQGDAADFTLDDQFGLAVSTFDALNHLPDLQALRGCFASVYPLLVDSGVFIFDLNTSYGLRHWTNISVEDLPELMLVTRAFFDEASQKAYTHISGFLSAGDERYERFEETVYEVAFALEAVKQALLETGFRSVHMAKLQNLQTTVDDPERESRIFFVAEK